MRRSARSLRTLTCALTPTRALPTSAARSWKVYRSCRVALWVSIPTCRSPAPLGWTYFWMGQPDAAIAEFEKAVALNSNFFDYRSAVVLVFAGQPERALHVLQAHIRLDPFHPAQLHAIRGVALYMLER